VRDDELVSDCSARDEGLEDRHLDELGGERLAVHDESGAAGLGPAQQPAGRVHPGFGRALRPTDPGQLGPALDPAAILEEVELRGELDTRLAEPVGELRGKGPGHERLGHPESPAGVDHDLEQHLVARKPLRDQIVVAELLVRVGLRSAGDLPHAVDLEGGEDDVPLAFALHVEERVGDRERQLVPELRRANRVRVDEDVRHGTGIVNA
jgi:hypothetical protein